MLWRCLDRACGCCPHPVLLLGTHLNPPQWHLTLNEGTRHPLGFNPPGLLCVSRETSLHHHKPPLGCRVGTSAAVSRWYLGGTGCLCSASRTWGSFPRCVQPVPAPAPSERDSRVSASSGRARVGFCAHQEEVEHDSPCAPPGRGARALPGCRRLRLFLLPFPWK